MAAKSKNSSAKLPQTDREWGCVLRQLRAWATEDEETFFRPWICLVLDMEEGNPIGIETFPQKPETQEIMGLLTKTMRAPLPSAKIKAGRPRCIHLFSDGLQQSLEQLLQALEVASTQATLPDEAQEALNAMIGDLEASLNQDAPDIAGLLSVPEVTPQLVGGLFAAAAAFYRAAPWGDLSEEFPLAITVPPEQSPRFVQLMGAAGMEYGVAMYKKWADLERMYEGVDSIDEVLPESGGHSLNFDAPHLLPFADLDAIETYRWEIADEMAYPMPVIYTRSKAVLRPSKDDLLWYEAALWAIPAFREQLKSDQKGGFDPLEVTIPIETHHGVVNVTIKYPGGELPTEGRTLNPGQWELLDDEEDEEEMEEDDELDDEEEFDLPDRRGMERQIRNIVGKSSATKLDQAQDLMYSAWEERNPAKRIAAAHKALAMSPDCADAYVLLAEEEADTVGRAAELYRKGVEAGERALGKAFFKEYSGEFWAILESRPYMRAREGLAHCLWQMGKLVEAQQHFTEMLLLNPGDNQGVRYSLLTLFLEMGQEDKASGLLQTYSDDARAAWGYTKALLEYRRSGASSEANRLLQEALRWNGHVPAYLSGQKRIPNQLPETVEFGGASEAIEYVASFLRYWQRTPGAVQWMQQIAANKPSVPPKNAKETKKSSRQRH